MNAIETLINTAQNAYEDHSEAACLGNCISAARAEHERLKRVEAKLTALENAGVDNWEGYTDALEASHE